MRLHRLIPFALQTVAVTALAQACPPPHFDVFTPTSDALPTGLPYQSANLVRMRVPANVTGLASLPNALGLRYLDNTRITLSLDDGTSLPVTDTASTPAERYLDALNGQTEAGCELIAHWSQLSNADYRSRYANDRFILFAYGSRNTRYEFIAINQAHPEVVLRGLVKGMSHAAFEALISTITPQDTP